jgi:hypothetical protein
MQLFSMAVVSLSLMADEVQAMARKGKSQRVDKFVAN